MSEAAGRDTRNIIRMYSVSKSLSTDVGLERLELSCEFHSDVFNLFDNPVQWFKTQVNETTQINLMGNLMEPFAASHRFRVALLRTHPRYNLQLTISGKSLYFDVSQHRSPSDCLKYSKG